MQKERTEKKGSLSIERRSEPGELGKIEEQVEEPKKAEMQPEDEEEVSGEPLEEIGEGVVVGIAEEEFKLVVVGDESPAPPLV